jgi:hypothetical protein
MEPMGSEMKPWTHNLELREGLIRGEAIKSIFSGQRPEDDITYLSSLVTLGIVHYNESTGWEYCHTCVARFLKRRYEVAARQAWAAR